MQKKIIHFECSYLEKAIRDADGFTGTSQGAIYNVDVQKIRVLKARKSSITSLAGIEHLEKLKHLDLSDNQISDITPLRNLKKLSFLDFSNNQVSDISSILFLRNLEKLRFSNNKVKDISPILHNKGIGRGVIIDIKRNNLDLTQNSNTMRDIQTLIANEVEVQFEVPSEKKYEGNEKRSGRDKISEKEEKETVPKQIQDNLLEEFKEKKRPDWEERKENGEILKDNQKRSGRDKNYEDEMIAKGNKQAIGAFVLGLIAIITSFTPFGIYVNAFGALAMLFSVKSFKNKTEKVGLAGIAIALGIIQLLVNAARYASGV